MDIGNCPPKPPVPQTTPFAYPTVTAEIPTTTTTEPPTQAPPQMTKSPATAQCTIPPGWCPCATTTANIWTPYPTESLLVSMPTTPEPQVFSPCAVDILFVLDSSGVNRTKFDRQIRFILDLLDLLIIRPDAHLVSAIVYDGHLKQRIQFSFTAYKDIQSLSKAVSDLPFFGGKANTGEALTLAKQALRDRRSASVPALVFLVSDGSSQDDVAVPADQLRAEPNTMVYALSATDATDK
uniref:VWFA domain-containing protein n=1 Tax=Romanomermis culicivorax TaxID=13658 RepID=A0A915HGD8_ROMCU